MINQSRFALLFLVILFCVAPGPGSKANAQDVERQLRGQFVFLPGFTNCGAAKIQGFGLGKQPLEVMLAQIYVESLSEKVIRQVRMSWKVYELQQGGQVAGKLCASPTPDALLSGGTDLIDVQALQPRERIIVGTNPLPVSTPVNRTVYVEKPFMKVWDVKTVVDNDAVKGRMYMVVLYISEVVFADGTQWVIKL